MNRVLLGAMAVLSGLLFYCPKVEACYPDAGFTEFVNEIEGKTIHHLPSYILTEEDEDLLLRIGVCEAGETDPEGIANCMQVVLNRFDSENFPNTISGVIFQKHQFSSTRKLATANITDAAYEALDAVKNGYYQENEALYFESLDGKVWSKSHQYLFSYGGHDFYK